MTQKCDECNNYASHIIIDKDSTKTTKHKFCCEHYMDFIKEESKEFLIRNCSVCGKRLIIRLYDDGHYKGGEYFGRFRIPLKIAKKPSNFITMERKKYPVVRILKYGTEVEYWECPKCYKGDERKSRGKQKSQREK